MSDEQIIDFCQQKTSVLFFVKRQLRGISILYKPTIYGQNWHILWYILHIMHHLNKKNDLSLQKFPLRQWHNSSVRKGHLEITGRYLVLLSFRLRFPSRPWCVQFSGRHSILHQVLLLLEKEICETVMHFEQALFWELPKATRLHPQDCHHSLGNPGKEVPGRPAMDVPASSTWELPPGRDLRCPQVSRADWFCFVFKCKGV